MATRTSRGADKTNREFSDITAEVDALLADPKPAPSLAAAREALADRDREYAVVSPRCVTRSG